MKPRILKATALLAFCLFILPMAGCATNNRIGRQPGTDLAGKKISNTAPRGIGTRLFATPGVNRVTRTPGNNLKLGGNLNKDERARADKIQSKLAKNKDISNVYVIIKGNDAIVGYVPARTKTGQDIDKLRNTVVKQVRQLDPGIRNIYLSDTRNLSDEIERLYKRMIPEKADDRIDNEIKQLMKKIPFVAR